MSKKEDRKRIRKKAYEIYEGCKGKVSCKVIADKLGMSYGTVRGWKSKDGWDKILAKRLNPKRKSGAQPGNTNCKGKNLNNTNAAVHGIYKTYLPKETLELVETAAIMEPLDVLWHNIVFQWAAIVRAQKIMNVENHGDHTKMLTRETRGDTSDTEEWEYQYSWDKYASFMSAQSRAMTTLSNMIDKYVNLVNKNWDLVTEEHKARIAVLKAQKERLLGENNELEDLAEIEGEIYGK